VFDVGGGELLIILLAVLLLFGPKKIPEVAQMVGKGIRQFRKAQEDLTQQIRDISAETASIVEEKPRPVVRPIAESAPRLPVTTADVPAPTDEQGTTDTEPSEPTA
jgi:TatA/E family protein of Tat protein translocase